MGTFRSFAALLLMAVSALTPSPAPAQAPAVIGPGLLSGYFDDYLILAADRDGRVLSGYYDDGACRFAFSDALTPVELYQRRDLGEAYSVRSWDPAQPTRVFNTQIYSRARGGFNESITLEPGSRDPNRPSACRSRITLDRASHVSNSFVAVRVVRKSRPAIFRVLREGGATRILRDRSQRPPKRSAGVWVDRVSPSAAAPAGYIYLNWYDPPGTPQGGYIRERDLYPVPPIDTGL